MRSAHRRLAALATVLVAVVVAAALAVLPASADPTNPTDQQLATAQAAKDGLAAQVGSLTAQLSQLQTQVSQTRGAAELAEQKLALALQQLQDARDAVGAARQTVVAAQAAVVNARLQFDAFVRHSYQNGSLQTPASALLTAADPTAMLQASSFQSYIADHQLTGIGDLNRATVAKANADAAARGALARQTQLADAAHSAQQQAVAAVQAAQAQAQQTQAQQAAISTQLDTAQATLLGLQNQRAAFDAWKAQQAAIARAQEAARQAALLAQQQAAAAAQQRASAAAAASSPASAGGAGAGGAGAGSGNGGGAGAVSTGSPTSGSWSAALAQNAVNRAMGYLGTPYSWAAGGQSGPTYGVCGTGGAGNNDCHVYGFDCSGLTEYAWAPYLSMAHYAATQYSAAGSYHPGTGALQPGDLLFWSIDGTVAGIHHEAMYVGNGNVIQAPYSGDVVRITSLWNVDSGYFGATRPLT